MEFPEYIDIQDQTYTFDVVPHVTQMADGIVSTTYETLGMDASTVTDLRLQSEYTWIENNLTLTYPTTYMWYGTGISAYLASDQDSRTATCSRPSKGTAITTPASADPSSFVVIAGTSTFGQVITSTISTQDALSVPSSILGYLDTLPEVQEQLNQIPLTSCAYLRPQPEVCTRIITSISTSCVSRPGNLSHTSCNEEPVTFTTTSSSQVISTRPAATEGPIIVPRKPAAYLTYNTLAPSHDSGAAALGEETAPVTPTPTQDKPSQASSTSESITESAGHNESSGESESAAGTGGNSHAVESQPAVGAIGDSAKPTGPEMTPDAGNDAGNDKAGSNGSSGSVSQTGAGMPEDTGRTSFTATATGSSTFDPESGVPPIFTFRGQTLTAGSAVTFGGSAVSELPNRDGVAIDHDHTVLLSDGEVTTVPQQDSQQPITLSRSGSAFIVNGETLSSNQQMTAGQTTAFASVSDSSAIVYINGTPTPLSSDADAESTSPSTGMGGYINSGIGGDIASASSDHSSESATGGAGTPATGDGFRASPWTWTCGWMVTFFAFLGAVILL